MNAPLPTAVSQAIALSAEKRKERMSAFAQAICRMRDEAIKGRTESGIELTWLECEEAYLGIDDENRDEFQGAAWAKPTSMDGPLTRRRRPNSSDGVRATGFVRMTSRYVDAAAAKIGEISLPIDGLPFSLDPSPVPELLKALEDTSPVLVDGQPKMRPATPEDALPQDGEPVPGQPTAPPPAEVPLTVADLAKAMKRKAEDSAQKAEKQIQDWMGDYGHTKEMRKVLFDGARLGAGVFHGPIPEESRSKAITTNGGQIVMELVSKIKPVGRWVDLWNCFPDPACGEDIHDGSYFLERVPFTKRQLQDMLKNGGFIREAVQAVIDEGPGKISEGQNPVAAPNKRQWTGWKFYGVIESEDLELHNPSLYAKKGCKPGEPVFAIVTMVNDTPIKVAINPLESGGFPYRVMSWRRRAGHWAGVGVAEQIRFPQRLVNAATRAMVNNAGKSAGSIIVMEQNGIVPADGSTAITPDKLYFRTGESVSDDIRKAFAVFQIPNVTPQLMQVIEYAFKLAEESSNIPLISQGQSGDTTPDTFGATQLQNNNANQLLRDVGFAVAESITEPYVTDLYEWLLLDPEVPNECKGDFKPSVSGSIALIEKAIQDQTIVQLGGLVMNPAFGLDPEKWAENFLRTKRLNPADFQLSEEKKKQMAAMPPPKAPAVQAAEIRAMAQVETAKSRDTLMAEKIRVDIDRDTALVESMRRRDDGQYEARMEELKLKREIAMLQYATQQQVALDKAKTDLARTTMELSVQRELAGKEDAEGAPQVADTKMEPVGQAPDGQAFQK